MSNSFSLCHFPCLTFHQADRIYILLLVSTFDKGAWANAFSKRRSHILGEEKERERKSEAHWCVDPFLDMLNQQRLGRV